MKYERRGGPRQTHGGHPAATFLEPLQASLRIGAQLLRPSRGNRGRLALDVDQGYARRDGPVNRDRDCWRIRLLDASVSATGSLSPCNLNGANTQCYSLSLRSVSSPRLPLYGRRSPAVSQDLLCRAPIPGNRLSRGHMRTSSSTAAWTRCAQDGVHPLRRGRYGIDGKLGEYSSETSTTLFDHGLFDSNCKRTCTDVTSTMSNLYKEGVP